ncbi:MAG TPA: hypothetical protein ENN42_06080 [Thioalkalivibrio sp.]|nr:hypothetical protein [Thioalkalivibrio sp.]
MKKGWILAALAALMMTTAVADDHKQKDWRKDGSDTEKLENLVKAVPSTARIMIEMGERYKNLYWAARQEKWEFAEYQVEEIEALTELLQITRPSRAATAQDFLDEGFEKFEAAFEKQEWEPFYKAFDHMRAQCVICHARNDYAFIILPEHPATATSPVLNLK